VGTLRPAIGLIISLVLCACAGSGAGRAGADAAAPATRAARTPTTASAASPRPSGAPAAAARPSLTPMRAAQTQISASVAMVLSRIEGNQLDGVADLTCRASRSVVAKRYAGYDSPPGSDADFAAADMRDMVAVSYTDVQVGPPAFDGDVAHARVTARRHASVNESALRRYLTRLMRAGDPSVDQQTIDCLVERVGAALTGSTTVSAYIRFDREDGSWVICDPDGLAALVGT
jgi:hypothetical protein